MFSPFKEVEKSTFQPFQGFKQRHTLEDDPDQQSPPIVLDIAILEYQQGVPITVSATNNHIVDLDVINFNNNNACLGEDEGTPIPWKVFKNIFFQNDIFEINDKYNTDSHKYISFLKSFRKVKGEPFSLLKTILQLASVDLNVSTNCFTKSSLIDLSKEISNIKTISDLKCHVDTSLSWSEIINLLQNNYFKVGGGGSIVILVISVVFKSANTDILPVVVKFYYNVDFTAVC
jgi:hypothetical protein